MRFLLSRFCLNYFGMLVNTPRMVLHGILNGVILFFLALKWAASTTLLKDFIWLVGWFFPCTSNSTYWQGCPDV